MIKHEDGSVTVESRKELAELLMSEPGVKWTSEEFEKPDEIYCFYDEEYQTPFRTIFIENNKDMYGAWNIKTWRKVKPRFKKYDVVLCWDDVDQLRFTLGVWNNTGIFCSDGKGGNTMFNYVELYTGPIPKHIKAFIDDMKAKEQ